MIVVIIFVIDVVMMLMIDDPDWWSGLNMERIDWCSWLLRTDWIYWWMMTDDHGSWWLIVKIYFWSWKLIMMIMIGDYYWKWLFIIMHDDYRWWLVIRMDLWWLLIDDDQEWTWLLIMMTESLPWLVHGGYGWRFIDDGWLRSWLIIFDNDWWLHNLSLFMMIIIDDLYNYFNFDNCHDGWLIGDHMMMIMDRYYELYRLIHVDCYWLIMMINMTKNLMMIIDHEWSQMIYRYW